MSCQLFQSPGSARRSGISVDFLHEVEHLGITKIGALLRHSLYGGYDDIVDYILSKMVRETFCTLLNTLFAQFLQRNFYLIRLSKIISFHIPLIFSCLHKRFFKIARHEGALGTYFSLLHC